MQTKTKRTLPLLLILLSVSIVACGGVPGGGPTQTPVYLIVTGETPVVTPTSLLADGTPDAIPDIFPTPYICQAMIVEQPFENGRMFWVGATFTERCLGDHAFTPGSGEIWVAIFDESGDSGEWLIFVDDWDEAIDPPYDLELTPPEGLLQPVRGFGKVWREKMTDEQREALGWAGYEEIAFVTDYRYEAGGFIDEAGEYVARPGLHTLITFSGETFYFDEPSQTFDYVPAE
jgi:hypothetical protein